MLPAISSSAKPQRAHLVGIGGAGMRALAHVLLGQGWRLSGSDPAVGCDDPLVGQGVACFSQHRAEHVGRDIECVIYSSAIPFDNPELRRATELGIPTVSYTEMLGRLMQQRHALAVAGTHGKSTTTAIAEEILNAAGRNPIAIYGASPRTGRTGCRASQSDCIVVEACEFRQNFLHLRPLEAAILNIEPDHFDCYENCESLEAAFARFAGLLPATGRLVVPAHDVVAQRIAATVACPIETFGIGEMAVWQASNIACHCGRYSFDLVRRGKQLGRIELAVAGRHNVLNALAAAALVAESGVEAEHIAQGISSFQGLRRRLEPIGTEGGISIWDDYAHHPTEISATLQTMREVAPNSRICCLFQPHQALRTARLLDELALSLQNAERVLIADIFRAREGPPQPGDVSAADLAARTRALGQDVPELHAPTDIQNFLQTRLAPGDVLIVMGAGDIGRIVYGLLDWFREHRAAG